MSEPRSIKEMKARLQKLEAQEKFHAGPLGHSGFFHVAKPVTIQTFVEVVRKVLDGDEVNL